MNGRHAVLILLAAIVARPAAAAGTIAVYGSADYLKAERQSAAGMFANVRAGILASGDVLASVSYGLEVEARDISRLELQQVWAGLTLSAAFRVRAGLFLVPFGIYNETSRAFETRLVESPLPLSEIYPARWRDIGLVVDGTAGGFHYAVYLGNGLAEGETLQSGQQFSDNNANKGLGGRLSYQLSSSFVLGASYYSGKVDTGNTRRLTLVGLDASWSSESIHLTAEYAKAAMENPAPFDPGRAEGWFILGSLDFGSISPLVSFQKYRASDAFHGAGFASPSTPGLGLSADRQTWAVGLVVTIVSGLLLKGEYDFNTDRDAGRTDNAVRAQMAFRF